MRPLLPLTHTNIIDKALKAYYNYPACGQDPAAVVV